MKKKVEIVAILDRSGSMSNIMDEAIAALNHFVEEQKLLPGKAKFTLVGFDDRYEVVLDHVKLKDVQPIIIDQVRPRGMTALNDAIGKTINSIESDNVVLLIQTDGFENASSEYTTAQIKTLIESKTKAGWDISFIGAGVDAFAGGATLGVMSSKCVTVDKNARGMDQMRSYVSATTTEYRK